MAESVAPTVPAAALRRGDAVITADPADLREIAGASGQTLVAVAP